MRKKFYKTSNEEYEQIVSGSKTFFTTSVLNSFNKGEEVLIINSSTFSTCSVKIGVIQSDSIMGEVTHSICYK